MFPNLRQPCNPKFRVSWELSLGSLHLFNNTVHSLLSYYSPNHREKDQCDSDSNTVVYLCVFWCALPSQGLWWFHPQQCCITDCRVKHTDSSSPNYHVRISVGFLLESDVLTLVSHWFLMVVSWMESGNLEEARESKGETVVLQQPLCWFFLGDLNKHLLTQIGVIGQENDRFPPNLVWWVKEFNWV